MNGDGFSPDDHIIRGGLKGYHRDQFDWQVPFEPLMRQIIGAQLLQRADAHSDRTEATDLIVRPNVRRVLLHMRTPEYWKLYPNDFCIRYHSVCGALSEIKRIEDGFGDWLFCGHAGESAQPQIVSWRIIQLHNFRYHWKYNRERLRFVRKANGDGSDFLAFDYTGFPELPPILFACSDAP